VKIDAYRSELSTQVTDRVGRPTNPADNRDGVTDATAVTGSTDEVHFSSGAQLMQTVMQSAQQALEIRQDLVQRMRAALANGTVGNDPHALADALLDRLTGTSTSDQSTKG